MNDKTYAWFGAHNYKVEPSVITQTMRLEPTKVFIKGQPKREVPRVVLNRANAWILDSPLPTSEQVEQHLEALLVLLESRADEIKDLVTVYQAELEIGCAIYYEDFTPGIHLSQNLLQRIANLGLSLDLDLHFLGENTDA